MVRVLGRNMEFSTLAHVVVAKWSDHFEVNGMWIFQFSSKPPRVKCGQLLLFSEANIAVYFLRLDQSLPHPDSKQSTINILDYIQ